MLKKLALPLLLAFAASANAAPLFNGNAAIPGLEASGMQVLYEINVPGTNPSYATNPVPYSINNLAALSAAYSRVGYYVEVTSGRQAGQFVYVSMDNFGASLANLGLQATNQTTVNNANIYSNNAGIAGGTGIGNLNLEMWKFNYATNGNGSGSDNHYDFDDVHTGSGAHGSFQIHNAGIGQTLFGWNDWGGNNVGELSEFGIGNATALGYAHADWTFSNTGQTGLIQIVVGSPVAAQVPEPASLAVFGLGLAAFGAVRRRKAKQAK